MILPVFPLKSLCFPGHCLALRVFEERYIQLLNDCSAADRRFVVALISRGDEVGGEATPYRVGTLVRYETVRNQGDFLMIKPRGDRRVYFESFDRNSHPYLIANCTEYPDNEVQEPEPETFRTLEELLLNLLGNNGQPSFHMREVLEAKRESLSAEGYSLFLCGCFQLPPIHLQHLLESRSTVYRVETLKRLLEKSQEEDDA